MAQIGDLVSGGQTIGAVRPPDGSDEVPVSAPFDGLLRGLIRDGFSVTEGFKIADVDPRKEERENCFTISDKARSIGGAVVQELTGFAARRAVDER
jgi:xanthine dehydrogenase accessory factor